MTVKRTREDEYSHVRAKTHTEEGAFLKNFLNFDQILFYTQLLRSAMKSFNIYLINCYQALTRVGRGNGVCQARGN